MNQLINAFIYENYLVRTVVIDNNIWFVLSDVCKALGLSTPSRVKERLEDGVSSTHIMFDSLGRKQELIIINEDGLYDVMLDSRKAEAKLFRKWITKEVLPSIRKKGGYILNEDVFVENYLPYADQYTKELFKLTLQILNQQNDDIASLKTEKKSIIEGVNFNQLSNLRNTAKILKLQEKFFIQWLLESRYLYRDLSNNLKPYLIYVPSFFCLKEWERNGKTDVQTVVTPLGMETFRSHLRLSRF